MNQPATIKIDYFQQILENNIETLEKKESFKLICGASLTSPSIIEGLSMLYSIAGASFIDITPARPAIQSALKGIQKAKKIFEDNPKKYCYFNEPSLMLSLNIDDDHHFNTAYIDSNVCNGCQQCIPECSFGAIILMKPGTGISIDDNICYGCGNCTSKCPSSAISLVKNVVDLETVLTKLIDSSITGLEIHAGTSSIDDICKYYKKVASKLENTTLENMLFSFSLESALYNANEFVDYANTISSLTTRKAVIQVDGTPMSGNTSPASSLQSLASGQILIKNNVNAYIQLAGGINHLTKKHINTFGIDSNGIAMGTFARKIVWPYLQNLDDNRVFEKAQRIATNLVKQLAF